MVAFSCPGSCQTHKGQLRPITEERAMDASVPLEVGRPPGYAKSVSKGGRALWLSSAAKDRGYRWLCWGFGVLAMNK